MKTVRIDIKTTNPSNGSFGVTRWAAIQQTRDRRKQRQTTARVMAATLAAEEYQDGVRVLVTRVAPSSGLDKHDGLPSACKSVVDGIADWLGMKDNDPRIVWRYDQRRGPPRYYAVEVAVEVDIRRTA